MIISLPYSNYVVNRNNNDNEDFSCKQVVLLLASFLRFCLEARIETDIPVSSGLQYWPSNGPLAQTDLTWPHSTQWAPGFTKVQMYMCTKAVITRVSPLCFGVALSRGCWKLKLKRQGLLTSTGERGVHVRRTSVCNNSWKSLKQGLKGWLHRGLQSFGTFYRESQVGWPISSLFFGKYKRNKKARLREFCWIEPLLDCSIQWRNPSRYWSIQLRFWGCTFGAGAALPSVQQQWCLLDNTAYYIFGSPRVWITDPFYGAKKVVIYPFSPISSASLEAALAAGQNCQMEFSLADHSLFKWM